jgi:hypothetical protein
MIQVYESKKYNGGKSMKVLKSFSKKFLAVALALTMMLPTTAITASAASCDSDVYVKTYKNGYYYTGTKYGAPIEITFDEKGDDIANIKSESDKLKVYRVSVQTNKKKGLIGVFATTPGTYKVSFDIIGADKKVKESKVVNVHVSLFGGSSVIKTVKYANKELWTSDFYDYVNIPAKGKLSVTLNKGYKLKSLRVGKYPKKGVNNYKYSKFKNGGNITLGKIAYSYTSKGTSYSSVNNYMAAITEVEVTYVNNKTKKEETTTFTLGKLVNYVK